MVLGGGVAQSPGGSTYTVKSGDTLAGIAARFSISLEDLRAANPGIDAASLSVGQSVRLPRDVSGEPPPSPTPEPGTPAPADSPTPPAPGPTNTPATAMQTYTVESGDIPLTIAEKFGITVEALLAANPGLDPTSLHAGDVLNIPPPPPPGG
jgi:peptidoglycan endopeptidase LytF